jgi:zinc protease
MKRLLMLSGALLVLLAQAGLAAGLALNVDQSTLDNGLMVLICRDTTVPTVSVQTFVNAGSRDEDRPGITGLAHVFEHMMFRGTEKYPDYSNEIAPLGAENNAYTNDDYTCYFVNAEGRFLEKVLDLESDRFKNLNFTNETFRTELGPVKEERRRGMEDPGDFLSIELFRLAFVAHTYQHPVIGWEEDLETKMTYEDGKQFKEHFYVPNNCVLVICGNVDVAKTRGLVQKYWGSWQRAEPYSPIITPEPRQSEEKTKAFTWKDDETVPMIQIGFHAPSARTNLEGVAALSMIGELLFSESGRLTRELRNNLAMVEGIWGGMEMRKDPSLFTITARVKKDYTLEQVRDSIYAQLEQLRNKLVTPEELDRVRNNLRADLVYNLDRPSRVAGSIGYSQLITGDWKNLMRLYDLYGSITAEKLHTAATETFDRLNRTVVTLVPKNGI